MKFLIPRTFRSGGKLRSIYTICRHLLVDLGWLKSFRAGRCVQKNGEETPWFTYPAIAYLSQLDLRERTVFEWGTGSSTRFWAKRAKQVVGIEDHQGWYEKVKSWAPENTELRLLSGSMDRYIDAIDTDGAFDIIVIDGIQESRLRCAHQAIKHLKPGGMIILDNSDDALLTAEFLRKQGLLQIDFTGFAPINVQEHCTSLFLHRDYNFQPLGQQPLRSPANKTKPWGNV